MRRRQGARNPFRPRSRSAEGPRVPAVAGILYPEERAALEALVDRLTAGRPAREPVKGVLAPHGAYASCGAVLGALFSRVAWTPAAVLVGPNHSEEGQPFGVAARGPWVTPLGEMPVDEGLALAILRGTKELKKDVRCHEQEHSLEVQVPFLQRAGKVRRIVPIAIGPADLEASRRIGEAVARGIVERGGEALVIGSANLTRCEPLAEARAKDPRVLERILAMDEEGLLREAAAAASSMCGAGAVAAVITAVRRLGASKGRLVRYQTSAEAGADPVSVSGYAGVVFQ